MEDTHCAKKILTPTRSTSGLEVRNKSCHDQKLRGTRDRVGDSDWFLLSSFLFFMAFLYR